jgi:translation initiation factor 1
MSDAKLVYSTNPQQTPGSRQTETENSRNILPPLGQTINYRREKTGRAGKTVTALYGFQASDKQLSELARFLQKQLATGGTVKNRRVELQGDQGAKLTAALAKMGYRPKQSGG